ncbi:MAG: sigma-70 family RNA polymerase sigma factor [Bacillati bacterium ANGP1]|uniref:Sigma-70 family RNA polymerase sigma factor n=1 Tax=Candidatus Segetimicrobium genomatis TaxID=2569760 RepID=A0A537J6N6_9BACT|nr:MAG: sigma-70 family RNA polymerase sigma factor [Terrabacteria group bacterium ANGP1]
MVVSHHEPDVHRHRAAAEPPAGRLAGCAGGTGGGPLVTLLGDSSQDPQQMTETMDLDGAIQAALDGLPEEFRTAVVLVDIEGLSYDEVASALRCPVGTVRSRLHRARQILRAALGPRLGARREDR